MTECAQYNEIAITACRETIFGLFTRVAKKIKDIKTMEIEHVESDYVCESCE